MTTLVLTLLTACAPTHAAPPEVLPTDVLDVLAEAQCTLCHQVRGRPDLSPVSSCAGCHTTSAAIRRDPAKRSMRGVGEVHSLLAVPSLEAAGARLKTQWLETYLESPHDLRPRLDETMPRLHLSATQIETIAKGLTSRQTNPRDSSRPTRENLEVGRQALLANGCTTCHNFGGAVPADPGRYDAPDLAHVRHRMDPGRAVDWIVDPGRLSMESSMPAFAGTTEQAVQIRDYLFLADPKWREPAAVEDAVAPLERPVRWPEVRQEVFRACEHCHLDPGDPTNIGRPSPGTDGAWGWPAGGVTLQSLEGARAVGDRIVPALLRRRSEARRDHLRPGERPAATDPIGTPGMPMGYPPLSDRKIALVAAWVEQGMPH